MEWTYMVDNNMDKDFLDVEALHWDYINGTGPMGAYSRAYYVVSWRGMETLQKYASHELALSQGRYAADNAVEHVREVKANLKENTISYNMRNYSRGDYMKSLRGNLVESGVLPEYLDGEADLFERTLMHVYEGNVDRHAYIETMANPALGKTSKHVDYAMKRDIIKSKKGGTDINASAGAHAYYNVIAPNYRMLGLNQSIDDDGLSGPVANDGSIITAPMLTEDDLMLKARTEYLHHLADSISASDDTATMTVTDAYRVMTDTVFGWAEEEYLEVEDDWNELVEYLKEDIVIMFESSPHITVYGDLDYISEIHEAVDLSVYEDFGVTSEADSNALGFNESGLIEKFGKLFRRDPVLSLDEEADLIRQAQKEKELEAKIADDDDDYDLDL